MSEAPGLASPPAAAPQTAGSWLRAARQAQGLHIAVLAAQLKVPQAKLEALEADRHQDLPDATFARALAKAMCRVLKVDAAPVLELLPRGGEPTLDRVSRGLNEPFRERVVRDDQVSLDWLKRPMIWAPALLLLAALAVYLLPSDWLQRPEAAAPEANAPVAVEPAPAPAEQASASLLAPAPAEPASVAAAVTAPVVVAPAVASAVAPAPAVPAAPQPGQVPLLVKASAESWVEVTDAQGQVQLSKLLRPGEQAQLNVLPPLRLRIGNVAGTELTLRGVAVDLASQSRDNVARLELK
ncbi:helix-turn-helix domain-containing protein [Roseateles sp. DAIF2]|nr:helix-turn-helix domain-containing protein [Roseateles sp. DAIF2]